MATGEVRQAGPALHPALGIRISQRFSDVRKVGSSNSLLANAALLPFGEVWALRGKRGGAAGSHGNTVGTVVCGAGRKALARRGNAHARWQLRAEPVSIMCFLSHERLLEFYPFYALFRRAESKKVMQGHGKLFLLARLVLLLYRND